jgi:hypothetical protein
MNRGELVKRVSRLLGMGADPTHGSDDLELLQDLADEAIKDILARTRLQVRCVDITLTEGQDEYELGDDVLQLHTLTRGDKELTEYMAGDVGRSGSYTYGVVGYNRLVLGWSPTSEESGLELKAWYTRQPTPMTDDAHDPSDAVYGGVPVEFHQAIVNYMAWHAADVVGDAGSGRGEKYRILYEGQDGQGLMGSNIGKIRLAINRRAKSGSSRARLPRAGTIGIIDVDRDYFRG